MRSKMTMTTERKEKDDEMSNVKEIASEIVSAHGRLEAVHKRLNAEQAKNGGALSKEERIAWCAVVAAIDALSPIYDWAIDNL